MRTHRHSSNVKHKRHTLNVSYVAAFGIVALLGAFVFTFFITKPSTPHISELSFVETSTSQEGSVIPASCDSSPPTDHFPGDCPSPWVSAWISPGTINYGDNVGGMGYTCGNASYADVYQNGVLVWGGAPTSYTWGSFGPYYSSQNWTFNCVAPDGEVASQTVYLTVNPPANCSYNGVFIPHGGSITMYRDNTIDGASCDANGNSLVVSCWNGGLSTSDYSYAYNSCVARTGSITPSSCTIPVGGSSCSATISWASANLASPQFINQTSNSVLSTSPSGSMSLTLTPSPITLIIKDASDNFTFDTQVVSATCIAGSSWSASANQCVLSPTASISANPVNSNYGYKSTLTWSGSNAQSCTEGGAWSNSGNISGSGLTNPLTTSQSFTYQCFNNGLSSAIATASVNVCPQAFPVWYNNMCNAAPRVVQLEIEGQYTPDGKLNIVCANADSFVVKKNGVDFQTVNASSGTVNVSSNGNYSVVCMIGTFQGDYVSSQSVMYYQTTPPPPIVSLRASPTTISVGAESVLTWDITFPGSVQVPARTCTLTASPVCANGNCTQAQLDEVATLNQTLAGRTDANDPGGASRLISTAINTVVNGNTTTGDTDWRAFGKKTLIINKTTDFLLWCGNGANESQQVQVKVTASLEH